MERHWRNAKIDLVELTVLAEQLAPFDPLDCFAALQGYFDEGHEFPPKPSTLVFATRRMKEENDAWERSGRGALPAQTEMLPTESRAALDRVLAREGVGSLEELAKKMALK